jgi:hypothetical protein
MRLRYGRWNVGNFSRFRFAEKVATKLEKQLDLVGSQEVRWGKVVSDSGGG